MDAFKTIMDKWGPVGLAVVIMAWLLYQGQKDAASERASHTALMIDQLSDLREKVERLETKCR